MGKGKGVHEERKLASRDHRIRKEKGGKLCREEGKENTQVQKLVLGNRCCKHIGGRGLEPPDRRWPRTPKKKLNHTARTARRDKGRGKGVASSLLFNVG